jgi:hypothetical protein
VKKLRKYNGQKFEETREVNEKVCEEVEKIQWPKV